MPGGRRQDAAADGGPGAAPRPPLCSRCSHARMAHACMHARICTHASARMHALDGICALSHMRARPAGVMNRLCTVAFLLSAANPRALISLLIEQNLTVWAHHSLCIKPLPAPAARRPAARAPPKTQHDCHQFNSTPMLTTKHV